MSGSVLPEHTVDQTLTSSGSLLARWRQRVAAWQDWANEHRWPAVGLGGAVLAVLVLLLMVARSIGQYVAEAPGVTLEPASRPFM